MSQNLNQGIVRNSSFHMNDFEGQFSYDRNDATLIMTSSMNWEPPSVTL